MQKKVNYPNKQFLKDYWFFLREYKLKFFFWLTLRLFTSLQNLVPVFVLGLIVDFFTEYSKGQSLNLFYMYLIILSINEISKSWVRLWAKFQLAIISLNAKTKARIKGFDKLMEFDLAWHEKETSGKKITRINTGADKLREGVWFLSNNGTDMFVDIVAVIIIFAALSWKYLVLAIVYAFLHLWNEYYHNKKQAVLTIQSNEAKEKAAGFLIESSSNILTTKTLGLRSSLIKKSEKLEKDMLDIRIRARKVGNMKWRWLQVISSACWCIFLLILGLDVANAIISVGMIVVYSGYFSKLRGGLRIITHNADSLIQIKYGVHRMMEIFNDTPNIKDAPDAKPFPKKMNCIRIEDVHFKYKDKDVLKGVSFTIKKGEKVGIVGRSGSGKSTLFKLFMGLYYPTQGDIRINKIPLNKIKHESLTKHMSVALQDTELFNVSLKENLGIASTKASTKNIFNAIKIAQLTDVVNRLPQKEKTLIGEKGFKLSGGERQRVGIARAILKDADILLLDEATANLDSKTEELIQKALKKELKNKTVITTAHRLSTLREMDRIIVMQKGKVIEQGKFNALIKKKGLFYKLYKLQSKKKH